MRGSDEEPDWKLEKFEPTRMEFPTLAEVPSVDELVVLAQKVEWLLIQVPVTVTVVEGGERDAPTTSERLGLVAALIPRLPTHRVWDGVFLPDQESLLAARRNEEGSQLTGCSSFSIRRVVTEQALEEHQILLVIATAEYRRLANMLMRRLAQQLDADLSEFSATPNWHRYEQIGRLLDEKGKEWGYFFHGIDCGFQNTQTGVIVEARLGFGPLTGDDFGVFDSGFFLKFINDSAKVDPDYRPLATLLRDYWENTRLALELLTRRGVLRYVRSDEVGIGWVVAPGSQETQ